MSTAADAPRNVPRRRGRDGAAAAGRDGTGRDGSGPEADARGPARRLVAAAADRPPLILGFLLSLALPFTFYLGPLRLAPYRVVLLAMIVPLFVQWLSGRHGKPTAADVMFMAYAAWMPFALLVHHGFERVPFGVITAIEAFGAYLLGRSLVRGPDAFEHFVRCLALILLALLPAVAYEALTGHRPLSTFLRGDEAFTGMAHNEQRWGMYRAQGPFEHPILFGVFAASGYGLAWYVIGGGVRRAETVFWTAAAGAATFFSLSMGAFLSGFVQSGLMGYDLVVKAWKARWKVMLIGSLGVYLFFATFSHRGLIGIVVEEMSFNAFAASVRLHTWNFGIQEVMAHPVFGVGFNDWARPGWLTSSVDNFWLLNAMRYGLPAALGLAGGIFLLVRSITKAPVTDARIAAQRTGFLVALAGLFVSLSSVHAWNALYSYFFFLLGAGAWMATPDADAAPAAPGRGADAERGRGAGAERGRGAGREVGREVGRETERAARPESGRDREAAAAVRRAAGAPVRPGLGTSRPAPEERPRPQAKAPVRQDPARPDPARPDPTRPDPVRPGPARRGPVRPPRPGRD